MQSTSALTIWKPENAFGIASSVDDTIFYLTGIAQSFAPFTEDRFVEEINKYIAISGIRSGQHLAYASGSFMEISDPHWTPGL